MATLQISDHYRTATNWSRPDPDYATLLATTGAASASTSAEVSAALLNTATRSPVVIAFVIHGEEDVVHIGHTLTRFPADLENATVYDNYLCALVGNDLASSVPVVLPSEAFQRSAEARCHTADAIVGVNGHGHPGGAVLHHGPHANGAPNTSALRARRAMLLPPSAAADILAAAPDGTYSLPGFWNTLIQPGVNNADAGIQALWGPVREWFRCASTHDAGGHSLLAVNPITSASPVTQARLNNWVAPVREAILTAAGRGGPGLTTAAFTAGIDALNATLNTNATNAIQYDRDRNEKTFTDRHGASLAQRMHRLCAVPDDASLPEVHRLLAKAPKGRDYAILRNAFTARAEASILPLNAKSAPLATTKLVDDVFRSFNPYPSSTLPGSGLSPFAMICEGHEEAVKCSQNIRRAEIASEGSSGLSLQDAETLIAADTRMPTTAYVVTEKIYALSVVCDTFHGTNHEISRALRAFALEAGPNIHRCAQQMGDTPALAMEFLIRCMYEIQQEYGDYVNKLAAGLAPTVPTFGHISRAIESCRDGSISTLPASYKSLITTHTPQTGGSNNRSSGSNNRNSSSNNRDGLSVVVNAHVDSGLRHRFATHGPSTISAMTQGHQVEIPKHAGKEICLTWALKGTCTRGCRRKEQHVRYSQDTIRAVHSLMDACDVATSQP